MALKFTLLVITQVDRWLTHEFSGTDLSQHTFCCSMHILVTSLEQRSEHIHKTSITNLSQPLSYEPLLKV